MIRYRRLILALTAVLSLAGCRPKAEVAKPPVALVSEIISDRNSPCRTAITNYDPQSSDGNIVVMGPFDEVRAYTIALAGADYFDNVDARPVRDYLPDFSGETISRLNVISYTPYKAYLGGKEDVLRELTVRSAVVALDTTSRKSSGKVVVLTSSAMCAFGKYDIDSLFRAFDVPSPVVFPLSLAADKALSDPSVKSIAVLSNQDPRFYTQYFSSREDASDVSLSVVSSLSDLSRLPQQTLILDSFNINADSLRVWFPEFNLIDLREETCSSIYRTMRSRNVFTHKVAYPKTDSFVARIKDETHYTLIETDD